MNRLMVRSGPAAMGMMVLIISMMFEVVAQPPSSVRRNRGEGLYTALSANTTGPGNWWVTGRGIFFIWDDNPNDAGAPKLCPFLEVNSELGITNWLSLTAASRLLSYTNNKSFQFGDAGGGIRLTTPNNQDLRFDGFGLQLNYKYNFVQNFASLGGYRNGGTGFAPEGFLFQNHQVEAALLYERDFLAHYSVLPLKLFVNAGARIPLDTTYFNYSQYLVRAGVAYVGLGFDVFVEYSLDAFFNETGQPKKFDFDWNWGSKKIWEVAFSENPMYITVGGRIRYENGASILLGIPLLISSNQGSDMTYEGNWYRLQTNFPAEKLRGINDPFDPWYAQWKIVVELSVPVFYNQTSAEMMRNFTLMKNQKGGRKIDIDEKLRQALDENNQSKDALKLEEDDKNKRLEQIRKKREEMQKE